MSKNVVIMESPTKTKAVQKYLGDDYTVVSSEGHITNLANKGEYYLGIDLETFTPYYRIETKKKPLVKKLQGLVNDADKIFLATDPDREGEAISYHLNEVLKIQNKSVRVSFNEITKDIVIEAFKVPRELDMNLVHSQEARRMIDRMIGFRLSKLLQKKIRSKSAGRVQSVALKLLVLREKEHQIFIPEQYWTIEAYWKQHILKLTKYLNKNIEIKTEADSQNIIKNLSSKYKVIDIQEKPRIRQANNPYTTSTMLQDGSSRLNFAANKTSLLAQQLYEGIDIDGLLTGVITYPRTDSIRLSDKFVSDTFAFITESLGKDYLGQVKITKKKNNVQDAHEAIRPTDILMTPEKAKNYLGKDQLRLYKLIYNRAMASLMAPAKITGKTIILDNNNYEFRLTGQTILFLGFLKYYQSDEEDNISIKLPAWKIGDVVNIKDIKALQHWTKPKPRYSEARLIKTLEELGVGRPSTYAPIMRTLHERGYVLFENKALKASEKGILTSDKLQEFFQDIISESYTSQVESQLDLISHGEKDYQELVGSFWEKFEPRVEEAFEKMVEVAIEKTGTKCPRCDSDLVYRFGKYGKFIGCSTFPKCRYISSLNPVNLGFCPQCIEGEKVIKVNRRNQKFIACSNYPECDFVESYEQSKDETEKATLE
ncbi:type I DNA topoisomerase [Spiroplasma endosymbiont of Clivina fossor]|uniref:type I DNA topoisomerase n=1 Tax=Spiroplasma endosymbiont of Clivina fossor TaxID=3066282 RepID=UPI00313C3802